MFFKFAYHMFTLKLHCREHFCDIIYEIIVGCCDTSSLRHKGTILQHSVHQVWVDFQSFVG